MEPWVLIFAMYASSMANTDFATIQAQEFNSKENCEAALKRVESSFSTLKDINAKAICVKK